MLSVGRAELGADIAAELVGVCSCFAGRIVTIALDEFAAFAFSVEGGVGEAVVDGVPASVLHELEGEVGHDHVSDQVGRHDLVIEDSSFPVGSSSRNPALLFEERSGEVLVAAEVALDFVLEPEERLPDVDVGASEAVVRL